MIEFENISICYQDKQIVKNLSFNIPKNEKVVIWGKSGSGKSSLLNLIPGFIQPCQGRVLFEKKPITPKLAWQIRSKIAYLDQSISLAGEKVSVLINYVSNLKNNSHLDFSQNRILELFAYFELNKKLLNQNFQDLSGGEKQRTGIIISILLQRELYLLDEITSALDKNLSLKTVNYFSKQKDITCLIVSHDPIWTKGDEVKIFDLEKKKWKR
ncbi:MAG: ATP-binding cassette domain-containing protein [Deltaproteobacteria bacterium]|nr:ATP-binding cassette domain-containing protein [Deltaproteobacteria bacterium]